MSQSDEEFLQVLLNRADGREVSSPSEIGDGECTVVARSSGNTRWFAAPDYRRAKFLWFMLVGFFRDTEPETSWDIDISE